MSAADLTAAAPSADDEPVPEPGPFAGWTAYVITTAGETRRAYVQGSGLKPRFEMQTAAESTIVLLDDGSFAAAWQRGRPKAES